MCTLRGKTQGTAMNRLWSAALAFAWAVGAGGVSGAQVPAQPADPGPPLSGYPRSALRAPTPAELKTATYVRDVIYGHRDGMALTYDVFKPVKKANGALVVNMVSAGWRSSWGPPEERQARYQALIDKGFTVVALYHASAPRFQVPDAVADVRLGMRHIRLHARDSPTLILQGDADKGVPPAQAQAMHAALDKAGVENRLKMFAGADHDFYIKGDPAKTDAYCTQAMTAMVAWFEGHLGK